MCLAVPVKIVAQEDTSTTVEMEGLRLPVSTVLCPEAGLGDYVLVHAGFAITVIDEQDVAESLVAFAELRQAEAAAG